MPSVQTENLSNLINSDRVRSSVRRLFQNDIAECLSELFQNSQRARATRVEITTGAEGFTYCDDGHGLLGGVAGFHTLLKIAESHFDNNCVFRANVIAVYAIIVITLYVKGVITYSACNVIALPAPPL